VSSTRCFWDSVYPSVPRYIILSLDSLSLVLAITNVLVPTTPIFGTRSPLPSGGVSPHRRSAYHQLTSRFPLLPWFRVLHVAPESTASVRQGIGMS